VKKSGWSGAVGGIGAPPCRLVRTPTQSTPTSRKPTQSSRRNLQFPGHVVAHVPAQCDRGPSSPHRAQPGAADHTVRSGSRTPMRCRHTAQPQARIDKCRQRYDHR
jgi:hypothetical protein